MDTLQSCSKQEEKTNQGPQGSREQVLFMWFKSSSAEKNLNLLLSIGHCSSFMLGYIICDRLCPSVWRVSLEITPVPWSLPTASSGHSQTLANLEKCPSGVHTETPKAKCSFVMKGKNLKHLSDGESWLLSILNEAERKVFSMWNFKHQKKLFLKKCMYRQICLVVGGEPEWLHCFSNAWEDLSNS